MEDLNIHSINKKDQWFGTEELGPDALRGLKILVIDDEVDHKIFIARMLERYGAVPIGVGSVSEAVHILTQYKPDIIISDIAMPDQDGYDFIRIFRRELEDPHARKTPVIALSAYTEKHWQVKSIVEGFEQHLAKPILRKLLVATVARLVHRSSEKLPGAAPC